MDFDMSYKIYLLKRSNKAWICKKCMKSTKIEIVYVKLRFIDFQIICKAKIHFIYLLIRR